MVRLGFIVEGATEKIILQYSDFFGYLDSLPVEYITDIIDAEGGGNLLPHNIEAYTKVLEGRGATHIFILTDLDKDECITNTKERIKPLPNHFVIVSKKTIEAWFLADTDAMRNFLNDNEFTCDEPETFNDPFQEIKSIRMAKHNIGVNSKPIFAKRMIRSGFSILKAAQHNNCSSAKYFLEKLAALSQ